LQRFKHNENSDEAQLVFVKSNIEEFHAMDYSIVWWSFNRSFTFEIFCIRADAGSIALKFTAQNKNHQEAYVPCCARFPTPSFQQYSRPYYSSEALNFLCNTGICEAPGNAMQQPALSYANVLCENDVATIVFDRQRRLSGRYYNVELSGFTKWPNVGNICKLPLYKKRLDSIGFVCSSMLFSRRPLRHHKSRVEGSTKLMGFNAQSVQLKHYTAVGSYVFDVAGAIKETEQYCFCGKQSINVS
jgi:hypothetical protein